jgi:hypothetical protein
MGSIPIASTSLRSFELRLARPDFAKASTGAASFLNENIKFFFSRSS